MKKILLTLLVFATIVSEAATPPRGKERLKELAVVPTMTVGFNFNYSATTTLSDLTNVAALDEKILAAKNETKLNPELARPQIQLARLLSDKSNTNAAKVCFEKAVHLARKNVAQSSKDNLALIDLGDALDGLDQETEAESVYRKATNIASNDWRSWLALGRFLRSQATAKLQPDLNSKDLSDFLSSIQDFAPSPDAMESARRFQTEAETCHERAAGLAPDQPEVFLQRAWLRCSTETVNCLTKYYRKEQPLELKTLLSSYFAKAAVPELQKASTLFPEAYQLDGLLVWFEFAHYGFNVTASGQPELLDLNALPNDSRTNILGAMAHLAELGQSKNRKTAAGALETLATIKFITKHSKDAVIADLRMATNLDPSKDSCWELLLGMMVGESPDEDVVALCEARVKFKSTPRNHFVLAKALVRKKDFKRAEAEARVAVGKENGFVPAHILIEAMLIKRTADEHECFEYLNRTSKLIEAMPDGEEKITRWREHMLNVAITHAVFDYDSKAKSYIHEIQKHFPDDEQAKEILNAIP